MRRPATLLSLVAIIFAAAMVLPTLVFWLLTVMAEAGKIWVLFAGSVLLFFIVFAVFFIVPRFLSRR